MLRNWEAMRRLSDIWEKEEAMRETERSQERVSDICNSGEHGKNVIFLNFIFKNMVCNLKYNIFFKVDFKIHSIWKKKHNIMQLDQI